MEQLYRWVKASVEPSQHYVDMCCRLIGEDFWFTAYLDWSKKVYVPRNFSGSGGYIDSKEIEYQVKVEADQQEKALSDALKEVERLKKIIMNQYYWNKEATQEEKDNSWQEFKINHNL